MKRKLEISAKNPKKIEQFDNVFPNRGKAVVAKAWPNSWGKVIPRDWTSLDCDSPQCKKIRNRDQGALLGLTLGMFEGIAKYAASKGGVKKAVGWLPESERGKAALEASRQDGAENIIDAEPLSLEEQARNWYNQTERNKLMAKNISPDQARMWEDLDADSQKKWTDLLEQNKQIALLNQREANLLASVDTAMTA